MANIWNEIKHCFKWTTQKETYVYISVVSLFALLGTIFNDFLQFLFTERMDHTTQSFTMGILFIHTFVFYLALLGFIYNTQAAYDTGRMANVAAISLFGNLFAFILRVTLEAYILLYRVEVYSSSGESGK